MDKIIPETEDLKIVEELVGLHSMNPFIRETSSARGYMLSSQYSQSLVPVFGEERIIQSGLEKQLSENTFSSKVENDSIVINVIPRYNGIGDDAVSKVTEHLVILESIDTGEIDYISCPSYHRIHNYFGFKYNKKDILYNLKPRDMLLKDTVLSDSYSVTDNGGYKNGANANLCLLNLPETAEDGVVISESLAEKLSYRTYETRSIEFGSDSFPLNIYGDRDNYKPFPEIGEMIGPDSILCALRKYDDLLSTSLTSINDVADFNPMFDKAVYVKGPGKEVNIKGQEFKSGVIVDVKVYTNPKYKKEVYTGVAGYVDRYAKSLKKFYKDILGTYNNIKEEHYKRFGDYNIKVSNKFHRLLIDALALGSTDTNKINYSYRNEVIDLYRVEFVVEYIDKMRVGNKLSDYSGYNF